MKTIGRMRRRKQFKRISYGHFQIVRLFVAKQVSESRYLSNYYINSIPVELGFLWDFEVLKFKTCPLYHEKLFIHKFKVLSSQVLNNFFSASGIMEAVRGHFRFYGMNAI
jgi:hypothetical protein